MGILEIFAVLIIIGIVLYYMNTMIPMQLQIKQIINGLAILLILFWLIGLFVPGLYFWRHGERRPIGIGDPIRH